jgi:isopenicillin N synthase-like dioxygenase
LLQRWTNDVFLATPHRAINRSGGERYALAFFCDSHIDWPKHRQRGEMGKRAMLNSKARLELN